METQNVNSTETQRPQRTAVKRKKIEIMNAKAFTVGSKRAGTWYDTREREVTDKRTGELKKVTDLLFKDDAGTHFAIPLDAGLRVALSEYNIKQGEFIELEKLEQIEWNGNMVNQYNVTIFQ